MQTINLKQYYPFCKEDIFVEVSDEIVEAFLLDKRVEAARERKWHICWHMGIHWKVTFCSNTDPNHAFYHADFFLYQCGQ